MVWQYVETEQTGADTATQVYDETATVLDDPIGFEAEDGHSYHPTLLWSRSRDGSVMTAVVALAQQGEARPYVPSELVHSVSDALLQAGDVVGKGFE